MRTHPAGSSGLLSLALSLSCATAAAQVDLLPPQDFETGLAPWSQTDGSLSKWHLAPPGECGAVTQMAAFNRAPVACDYATAVVTNVSFLWSPEFITATSSGDTVNLTFDYRIEMDAGELSRVELKNLSARFEATLGGDFANSTTLQHVVLPLPNFGEWLGAHARIDFLAASDNDGNRGFGWQVDNIHLVRTWTNLGHGKAGVGNPPALVAHGALEPDAPNELVLTAAASGQAAFLFVGSSALTAHFKGGVLVPKPDFMLPTVTGHAGSVNLPFVLRGVPSGLSLYVQFWITDPAASFGFSASNALVGITP